MNQDEKLKNTLKSLRKKSDEKWEEAMEQPIDDFESYYFNVGYSMGLRYAVSLLQKELLIFNTWE